MKRHEEKGKEVLGDSMLEGTPREKDSNVGYKFLCNTCKTESELFWQHSECILKCKEHIKSTGHRDVHVFPCYFIDP